MIPFPIYNYKVDDFVILNCTKNDNDGKTGSDLIISDNIGEDEIYFTLINAFGIPLANQTINYESADFATYFSRSRLLLDGSLYHIENDLRVLCDLSPEDKYIRDRFKKYAFRELTKTLTAIYKTIFKIQACA